MIFDVLFNSACPLLTGILGQDEKLYWGVDSVVNFLGYQRLPNFLSLHPPNLRLQEVIPDHIEMTGISGLSLNSCVYTNDIFLEILRKTSQLKCETLYKLLMHPEKFYVNVECAMDKPILIVGSSRSFKISFAEWLNECIRNLHLTKNAAVSPSTSSDELKMLLPHLAATPTVKPIPKDDSYRPSPESLEIVTRPSPEQQIVTQPSPEPLETVTGSSPEQQTTRPSSEQQTVTRPSPKHLDTVTGSSPEQQTTRPSPEQQTVTRPFPEPLETVTRDPQFLHQSLLERLEFFSRRPSLGPQDISTRDARTLLHLQPEQQTFTGPSTGHPQAPFLFSTLLPNQQTPSQLPGTRVRFVPRTYTIQPSYQETYPKQPVLTCTSPSTHNVPVSFQETLLKPPILTRFAPSTYAVPPLHAVQPSFQQTFGPCSSSPVRWTNQQVMEPSPPYSASPSYSHHLPVQQTSKRPYSEISEGPQGVTKRSALAARTSTTGFTFWVDALPPTQINFYQENEVFVYVPGVVPKTITTQQYT